MFLTKFQSLTVLTRARLHQGPAPFLSFISYGSLFGLHASIACASTVSAGMQQRLLYAQSVWVLHSVCLEVDFGAAFNDHDVVYCEAVSTVLDQIKWLMLELMSLH